jgi:hypothetical protein
MEDIGAPQVHLYHRLESPTQTPADAAMQTASGEIWGRAALLSHIPKVKAHRGPLPEGERGVEFWTEVPPDSGSTRQRVDWSGPRPGVEVEDDFAKIVVVITKNTQT